MEGGSRSLCQGGGIIIALVAIIIAVIVLGQGGLLLQLSWWGVMVVVTACITAVHGGVWSRGDSHAGGGRRVIDVDNIRWGAVVVWSCWVEESSPLSSWHCCCGCLCAGMDMLPPPPLLLLPCHGGICHACLVIVVFVMVVVVAASSMLVVIFVFVILVCTAMGASLSS